MAVGGVNIFLRQVFDVYDKNIYSLPASPMSHLTTLTVFIRISDPVIIIIGSSK